MARTNKVNLEDLILSLFNHANELTIHKVAQAANFSIESSADKRAIQRAFKNLVVKKIVVPQGNARNRKYSLITKPLNTNTEQISSDLNIFNNIELSQDSKDLLKYISGPTISRIPVSYNQDFLRFYQPNKTFYLSERQREELFTIGEVENNIRPAGTYARNILNRLLIDLSWNSSRLEGNTYSLLETKRLIELGESAAGKDASEAQMILNHKGAIEYIVESIAEKEINSHEVCSIHALLSENLLGDSSASGRIRQISVGISGSVYLPLENPYMLKECFQIFIEKLNLIKNPFEQSFFSLVHLSYLQAFEDVNKRTARLVSNIPLIKENLKPLSFADVERDTYIQALLGVYEKNDISLIKDLYLWAYKRSAQKYSAIQEAMGEPNKFKLKHRNIIQEIIRNLILEKVSGQQLVIRIKDLINTANLSKSEATELFVVIENEILNLHSGNIARFKIRPSEFKEWQDLQS